jgi:2-keto-3-deoxy-L-rhamnonate aldolase
MAAHPPPTGVYVPVPTFFVSRKDPRYSAAAAPLDLETQAKHSIYLAKCGIRGLVILGSTGEAVALTNEERSLVLSHVQEELEKAGFKNYPIIAGTATQSIADTIQQLKDATQAGAQWGLCLAPGYFAGQVTQEGIQAWYTAIADLSPIPIMMYVASNTTCCFLMGSPVESETLLLML